MSQENKDFISIVKDTQQPNGIQDILELFRKQCLKQEGGIGFEEAKDRLEKLIEKRIMYERIDEHEKVYNKAINLNFEAFVTWSDEHLAQLKANTEEK